MQRFAQVLLALWIGGVASVALIVAPRAFGFLDDNRAAGDLLVPIFARVDYLGMAAAVVFAIAARASRWRLVLALVLGALAAVNVFVLAPGIAARGEHFELLHHLATALWTAILLGGVVLLGAQPVRA